MANAGRHLPDEPEWSRRMFGDVFNSLLSSQVSGAFNEPLQETQDRINDILRAPLRDIQNQFRVASIENLGIGSGAFSAAKALRSGINAEIARSLVQSMPDWKLGADFGAKRFADLGLPKLGTMFGLDLPDIPTYARLGAWAIAAGVGDDLLEWGAEAVSEDPEIKSELDALATPGPRFDQVAEGIAGPETGPLPIVNAISDETDRSVERLARIGVTLVLAFMVATVLYVVTGNYPYWALVLSQSLNSALPRAEDFLTKKVADDWRRHPESNESTEGEGDS